MKAAIRNWRAIGLSSFAAVILLMIGVRAFSLAQVDLPPDRPSDAGNFAEVGHALRSVIGFGRDDILPALAGDAGHRSMIQAGMGFASDVGRESEMGQLADEYRQAYARHIHDITWAVEPDELTTNGDLPPPDGAEPEISYEDARFALVNAAINLLPDLEVHLAGDDQAKVDRVVNNLLLDPEVRSLNLNERQLETILAAQQERNEVLLNATNWYKDSVNAAARANYEQQLRAILRPTQRIALDNNRQLLAARRAEMQAAEVEAFDASDGTP